MKKIYLALFFASILITGCGPSINFSYDFNSRLDFSSFQTFAVADWNKKNSDLVDEFTKERIHNAMRKEMRDRGYREVGRYDNPDLVVDVFVVTNDESYVTSYSTHVGGYQYYSGYNGWFYTTYSTPGTVSTNYIEHHKLFGTMVVDVFDEKDRKLAYQGIIHGELKENHSISQERMFELLQIAFKKYPTKKIK